MEEGKLPLEKLRSLLKFEGYSNDGIVMKGGVGLDVAVIDLEQAANSAQQFYGSNEPCTLVVKSDPITFPTAEPGKYAVIVNSNDISCAGAIPFGFLATIIAPPNTSFEEIMAIQQQMHEKCLELKISLLGGHTEISASVNSIIVSGHMFGFVPKDFLVNNKLVVGDKILVIGYVGAEGTGIIIDEAGDKIREILSEDEIKNGKNIGKNILVLNTSLELNKHFKPSLFHDVTEGGIWGALNEMVKYTQVGIELNKLPPISKVTKKLAKWLEFDPYRLISSGALIVAIAEDKVEKVSEFLKQKDIPFSIIGTVTEQPGKVIYRSESILPAKGDAIIDALKNLGSK